MANLKLWQFNAIIGAVAYTILVSFGVGTVMGGVAGAIGGVVTTFLIKSFKLKVEY